MNGLQHRWNYLSGQLKTDATNLLNLNGLPHVLRLDLLFCPEEMLSALDLMLQHRHKKIVWSLSPQNEQDEQCNLVLQGLTLRNAYWDPHHRELRETVREGGGIDVVVQSSFSKQQSLDSATHDKEERRALKRRESNKGRPLVYGLVVAAEHGTREDGGGGQRKVVGNTNSRQVVGNTNSRGPCEDWSRAFEPRECAQSGALVEKRGLPVPVIFCADLLSLRWFTVPVV